MKLTAAQSADIRARIDVAFGDREVVTMNTSGQIGQTNFYGDEAEPRLTRDEVMNLIECALTNWPRPEEDEDMDELKWADSIVATILADII